MAIPSVLLVSSDMSTLRAEGLWNLTACALGALREAAADPSMPRGVVEFVTAAELPRILARD